MRVLFALAMTAALVAQTSAATCSTVENMVVGTGSIAETKAQSAADCCNKCGDNFACVAFTFHASNGDCFLKDNVGGNTSESGATSGTNGRQGAGFYGCVDPAVTGYKYCDSTASLADRVADLVPRILEQNIGPELTARESISDSALGIPAYYWGTNAIHGLQNLECLADGRCPTSFPAPVSMSSTFNMSLVRDMGAVLGRELRAYYNNLSHNSLDTWSPTINLNRDPRWGRNVESPGEDPLMCGSFGSAYSQGLQRGEDPSIYQAIVTLKHWVAYSVESYNGVTRHTYDAKVSEYDLEDSFFPAWRQTIQEGGAMGIMCSYNEVNGKPTCGNPDLHAVLRGWGYNGYVTSDSDSCADIYRSHHYVETAEQAVRACMEGGTDIDSGSTYSGHVASALDNGNITRELANERLSNAYRMRFLLGLFDPNKTTPYRQIPVDVVGSDDHQATSLMASRKAMVLLKNAQDTLPFAKGKKIALIGQNANNTDALLGNYNGPICAPGTTPPHMDAGCYPNINQQLSAQNVGGTTSLTTDIRNIDAAVQAAQAADQVVLVVDNAYDGGGEGHDRYNISLSSDQIALANAVLKVGKPTVLVMVSGGIISLDDLTTTAPAILSVGMPGVHGAQAIAETIFGDNNPGGKLPVTMYHSSYINEVDFLNMSMEAGPGRSYRYYTGTPLYPFGFGLSYTTFSLTWSPSPPGLTELALLGAQSTTYTCTVKNTGSVAGDEVVLAFFKPQRKSLVTLSESNPVPIKQLFGFQRVSLGPGESTQVSFTLSLSNLALVDVDGHRSIHPGDFDIVFSRGHGQELVAPLRVHSDIAHPKARLSTFRKWW